MDRFFEKAANIEAITTKEIDEFLKKENLQGKVSPHRVKDFYNSLSCTMAGEDIKTVEDINYDFFNCKTRRDKDSIHQLRDEEKRFVKKIRKESFSFTDMLKVATVLSYKFENREQEGEGEGDIDNHLKNILNHYRENQGEGEKDNSLGSILSLNVNFIKYLALLSRKKAFQAISGRKVKDNGGKMVKYTPMEDFSEIHNMDLVEVALPGFSRKLTAKDLYVRARFSKADRAQNLIILIDDSGSMSDYIKKGMLEAAITLKLRDHCEAHNVYIGTFITEVFGFVKIEKGMKYSDLNFICLNKGTTDVNQCVKDTISFIKKRELPKFKGMGDPYKLSEDHFEIMIINDGSDSVDPSFHPTIKIHALCLMQSNRDLKNICHRSGGTYHYLTED